MHHTQRRSRRAAAAALALAAAVGLLSSGATPQDDEASPLERTRSTLSELAETRRLISQERRQWKTSREVLDSQIEVVRTQIEELRAKIREAEANIAEADKEREQLLEKVESRQATSDALEDSLAELEARTKALLPRFPEPLMDIVRPVSQRIPEDSETTEVSVSNRFLSVVGVLKFANKFQSTISVGSEVRTLPDGSSSEVTAMYAGLGQAWYANTAGTVGGQGTPGPDGWVWSPLSASSKAIARAIAIQASQEPATFVQLPVAVD